MENNNPVSSKLVFYIWMLHTLKNIRQNSIFYDSKSATHETFVTGKVTFRICHDEFVMSLARSNCGYSFKMPLSFVSDNYYTEAAKIIKEPPAALPKREFHVHRHSQACLRSTSTFSAAEFIYHREQYCWLCFQCWRVFVGLAFLAIPRILMTNSMLSFLAKWKHHWNSIDCQRLVVCNA